MEIATKAQQHARGGTDPPGQFVVLPVPLVLFVVSSPEELDVATEGTNSTENHRLGVGPSESDSAPGDFRHQRFVRASCGERAPSGAAITGGIPSG